MKNRKDRKRSLKKFFVKVKEWFVKIFTNASKFIDEKISPTIAFMQVFKESIDNPSINIITATIPGEWDNKIIAKLRQILPVVIKKLQVIEGTHRALSQSEIIKRFIITLRNMSPAMKSATIFKTASLLVSEMKGADKFDKTEIDTLVQVTYNQLKEEIEDAAAKDNIINS